MPREREMVHPSWKQIESPCTVSKDWNVKRHESYQGVKYSKFTRKLREDKSSELKKSLEKATGYLHTSTSHKSSQS